MSGTQRLLALPNERVEPIVGVVAFHVPQGNMRFLAVGHDFDAPGANWGMWQLEKAGAPLAIGSAAFLEAAIQDPLADLNELGGNSNLGPLRRGYQSTLHEIVPWGPNRVLVNFLADSVYSVDLFEGRTDVFAQPGGGVLQVVDEGTILYLPSIGSSVSHRCFFIAPEAPAGKVQKPE